MLLSAAVAIVKDTVGILKCYVITWHTGRVVTSSVVSETAAVSTAKLLKHRGWQR